MASGLRRRTLRVPTGQLLGAIATAVHRFLALISSSFSNSNIAYVRRPLRACLLPRAVVESTITSFGETTGAIRGVDAWCLRILAAAAQPQQPKFSLLFVSVAPALSPPTPRQSTRNARARRASAPYVDGGSRSCGEALELILQLISGGR